MTQETPHHPILGVGPPEPVCPPQLLARARSLGAARVAVACADAPLPLESARAAVEAGVMIPLLVGKADRIRAEAGKIGWALDGAEILDVDGEAESAQAAAFAVREGRAEVLMKGQAHTDVFMKAALSRDQGLRSEGRFWHVFHMSTPHSERPFLISDAAVNVSPDVSTRQIGLRCMVEMLTALGNTAPKIAILSATEEPIKSVPSAIEAAELRDWAAAEFPQGRFSGPLALDLILSRAAAAVKRRDDDPVTGDADGVLAPDIVAGNALFKAMVYMLGACSAGVVMGGRAPITLTSRADPPAARLASLSLAAILSRAPR